MFTLLIFIIILSIMILVHEFGHFYQARRLGIRVEKFALGFGPKLFSFKKGDTEYALCLFAFGGYVKLAGNSKEECLGAPDELFGRGIKDRAKVIFAGPALNYILAFLCFWLVGIVGYPNMTTRIGELMDDFPAKSSGLLKDDKIIAIDGKAVEYWPQLQEIVHKKNTPVVELEILRGTEKLKIISGLKQKEIKNIFGAVEKINLIGIRPSGESVLVRHNIFSAFILGGQKLIDTTVITYMAFGKMLTGAISIQESMTGPLGMFYITSQAISLGISAVLHFMAIFSVSLAICNLLPFPVMDGGHLLLLGIEKLRGKRLEERIDNKISQAGVFLIIFLAAFIFLNDCNRFGVWDKITSLGIRGFRGLGVK